MKNLTHVGGQQLTPRDWSQDFKHLIEEEQTRCWDVTIDDVFAVPTGRVWYVKSLYITTGSLYVDGEVKVIG